MTSPITAYTEMYEVEQLQARQQEIVRLHVLGLKNVEVAEQLNISPQTVSNTINSPLVQSYLRTLQEGRDVSTKEINTQLNSLRVDAVNAFKDILQDQVEGVTPSLKMRAATEVLDRTGHGKEVKINNRSGLLSPEDIEGMKTRFQALKHSANVVIEVSAEEAPV